MRLQEIIRTVTESIVLWQVPGLKKAFVTKSDDGTILNTDGINFHVSLLSQLFICR